jgi:Ca2+-binding RTX toxin-like protein
MAITNIVPANSSTTASGDGFALSNGNQLNIFAGAYVLTSDIARSGVYMTGNSALLNDGSIFGNLAGIWAGTSSTGWSKTITIGETGTVSGAQNGIYAEGVNTSTSNIVLRNAGEIRMVGQPETATGAAVNGVNVNFDLGNTGTITSSRLSGLDSNDLYKVDAIRAVGTFLNFVMTNSGVIDGGILVGSSSTPAPEARLLNTGQILGNIRIGDTAYAAPQTSLVEIVNSGVIQGRLEIVAGQCNLDLTDGLVTGQIRLLQKHSAEIILDGATIGSMVGNFLWTGDIRILSSQGAVVRGQFSTYNGADYLNLSGASIGGWIYTNAGADRIVMSSGELNKGLVTDYGADFVDLSGNAFVRDGIFLGEEDDTLLGSVNSDQVSDGVGNDLVTLGDGDDRMKILDQSYVGPDGQDTLAGGAGIDWLDASGVRGAYYNISNANLWISLEEGMVSGDPGNVTDYFGIDWISGFENVLGGAFFDRIIGDKAANVLRGGDGDDTLFGMAGADTLRGDAGADLIVGGAGRDILTGGGGGDFFEFRAEGDSKAGTTTRDVITDFEQGSDLIGLFLIDARPDLAGIQAFTFAGMAGTSGAGTVRAQAVNDDTLIEVNLSASNRAEIAILLRGTFTLTADDFAL